MTEYHLHTPLSDADVEKLVAGDVVFLSGPLFTARDKAHALIRRAGCPVSLEGAALYHCGPLILDNRVLSAGPTTSGRMARYTDEILCLGVRAIIGKGGLPLGLGVRAIIGKGGLRRALPKPRRLPGLSGWMRRGCGRAASGKRRAPAGTGHGRVTLGV